MKSFDVVIEETLRKVVTVDADSKAEAEQIAEENWKEAEYILDAEDFVGVTFSATKCEPIRKRKTREER